MASVDYLNRLRDLKVPTYTSQYGGVISGLMDKIVNRQPFSYDFNADPIYHQYKDQYIKLGKEAAMNAVANASALTGGYGNSYAVTAGAQANQQALSGLNDIIPQLLNSAQKKYDSDTNALLTQYDIYNQAEQDNYGKFRDQMSDYNNERAYLTGMYNDALAQENYEAEQAEEQRRYETNLALQMAKQASKGGSGSGSGSSTKSTSTKDKTTKNTTTHGDIPGVTPERKLPDMNEEFRNVTDLGKPVIHKKLTSAAGYRDYALTQEGIRTFNNSQNIDEVERMLESQIKSGKISESEAMSILDNIMKNIHY